MKFKLNFKLTSFLVSLFIGILLTILGNKSKYCLSFGFIIIGLSLVVFVLYVKEKMNDLIAKNEEKLTEFDDEELDDETVFIKKELYMQQHHLNKKKKSVNLVFCACATLLIVVGIINLF